MSEEKKMSEREEHKHVHHEGCSHDHGHGQIPHTNHLKKVGRNDPCPCNSGKKFKKCCLNS